jgi:hypothetical protein
MNAKKLEKLYNNDYQAYLSSSTGVSSNNGKYLNSITVKAISGTSNSLSKTTMGSCQCDCDCDCGCDCGIGN